MSQQYTFQAETQQLLNILIHSLYTEREIFLRELLSNASDALNRMQFEQLTNENVVDPDAELAIRVSVDEDAGTITLHDTGVGMTRDEMIENLGTIARSGARAFIDALQHAPSSEAAQNIIGQFGVGFYSVFMVADKVQVVSRSFQPDAEAALWESDGSTNYSIDSADKTDRGTDIIIHLNDESKEYAREWKIKDIIRRHSDYVAFPIYVGDDDEATNQQTAIWRQSPSEVEDEAYDNFYRMMTMDFGEAKHRLHIRADVPMQFYALLFVPSTAEPNMFSPRKEPGLKLYARKVMIQEYSKELLPEYLQFMQGVVDSEDLPLNVSRESVQANRIMANLRKTLTNRVLSEFRRMAKNKTEDYLEVYAEFGRFIKQGLLVAPQDRDDLMPLFFFNSSHDDDRESYHSLDDYVDRMVSGQEDIYYVVADDFSSARRSPHLDAFRQRGIEVLYFCDPVDAALPMNLTDYNGHIFRSADDADIDLSAVGELKDDAQQPDALAEESFEALREHFQSVLGQRVKAVRQSRTLVGSPARLVSDEGSTQRHMFRINRLLEREYELPIKTLELNSRHPLLHNLNAMLAAGDDARLLNMAIEQIFETALLQDGIHPDPAGMADRLNLILQAATATAAADLNPDTVTPVVSTDDDTEDDVS